MRLVYQCERCSATHGSRTWIFPCLDCERETCDSCMHGWATCKSCALSKTDQALAARFNDLYELDEISP